MRELKKSDVETKQMVMRYIDAVQLIMKQDSLVVLFDKLPLWIRKHDGFLRALADQPLLPRRQRSFARFNLVLANTVGYHSDDLCLAPA